MVRADDERKAMASVSAACAVCKLPNEMDTKITSKSLGTNLQDLIHQAWHPRDKCYEVVL